MPPPPRLPASRGLLPSSPGITPWLELFPFPAPQFCCELLRGPETGFPHFYIPLHPLPSVPCTVLALACLTALLNLVNSPWSEPHHVHGGTSANPVCNASLILLPNVLHLYVSHYPQG